MGVYNRTIEELETKATLWWPDNLKVQKNVLSVIPRLLSTHDEFVAILKSNFITPSDIFDHIARSSLTANVFLKHLAVVTDYGGEPIQRLGRSFKDIFNKNKDNEYVLEYWWNENKQVYAFQELPIRVLNNKKLKIDGIGLNESCALDGLFKDMIMILLFGGSSDVSDQAGLDVCNIGSILGDNEAIDKHVRQRYIAVSRITGGATANDLGQVAQTEALMSLKKRLDAGISLKRNGSIMLNGYDNLGGMPFDIVAMKEGKMVGIEVSFQVTTNSTIERKAGQAADRFNLMHNNGYHIAYIIDGAGNFQRKSAISNICSHSDCTVAYTDEEFDVLAKFINEKLK